MTTHELQVHRADPALCGSLSTALLAASMIEYDARFQAVAACRAAARLRGVGRAVVVDQFPDLPPLDTDPRRYAIGVEVEAEAGAAARQVAAFLRDRFAEFGHIAIEREHAADVLTALQFVVVPDLDHD